MLVTIWTTNSTPSKKSRTRQCVPIKECLKNEKKKSTLSICFCLITGFKGGMSGTKEKTPRKIQTQKGKAESL